MDVEVFNDDIILVGVDYIGGNTLKKELTELIDRYDPASIGLALCEKRFETLEEKKEWLERPLLSSYRGGESSTLMYQIFVDAVRENLRKFKKLEPETHIAELVDVADYLDVNVKFIDRDITVTLKRAVYDMSPVETFKVGWYFKSAMLSFSEEKKARSVDEIEKHDDIVEGVLSTLDEFSPKIAEKARGERLEYMSKRIYSLSKEGRIIAVIPKSKMKGVKEKLTSLKWEEKKEGEISGHTHLEEVGKKMYKRILRYASPLFFISLAVYLFLFSDVLTIWRAWLYWFIAVGGMASLGALIGRGHILSILTSFVLAPFMSLTLIGPGWIAGYVEAKVRKPKIHDIQDLIETDSIGGFLSNNLIRPIMVGIFANIFTWLGLFIVLPLLISFVG
ncbi:MAG: TraB family protein [Candidatus Natronoplasma sp.]